MTRRPPRFLTAAAGAAASIFLVAHGADGLDRRGSGNPDATVRAFHERVESYIVLRHQVAPLAQALGRNDPLSQFVRERYLAEAIRATRSDARQGDIFTPAVEALFRQLVADSIGERDGEAFLAELGGGEVAPRGLHPTVNEAYSMTRVFRLPADVRLGLPLLPSELDYRVAGHDLLVWDIGAGIVVDFLPDAFVTRIVTE